MCQGRAQIGKFLSENEKIYNDNKKTILEKTNNVIQN